MADEQHCPSLLGHLAHFSQALFLECGIPYCQHFIYQQNFWFQVGGHSEGQAHIHAARVAFDRRVQKLFDFGKFYDFMKLLLYFSSRHTENGAIQVYVLAPCQLGMETSTYFQERANASINLCPALSWPCYSRKDL